jgi:hypothetical protein
MVTYPDSDHAQRFLTSVIHGELMHSTIQLVIAIGFLIGLNAVSEDYLHKAWRKFGIPQFGKP